MIFVSIASYRDPQLEITIADCIAKANDPAGLRFGICWQHDAEDPPFPYLDDPRFRVLDVDWRASRGACWARAEIMKLWDGEDWFLQVDSHCRFARGWDELLLRTVIQTGSAKPVITTYAPGFIAGEEETLPESPLQIMLQAFAADGIPQLRSSPLADVGWPRRPLRARFLSAGFLFSTGRFVEEVPYDPDLYFLGEESSMTVRAFTHGYDLFHPYRCIVWHDYMRADAKRHWGDHEAPNPESRTDKPTWRDLDIPSRRKVQRILRGEPVENFGLGAARTIQEYEAYAGISFRRKRAQQYTIRGDEPPNPEMTPDWVDSIYTWIAKITVKREDLSADALEDPHVWMVSVYDGEGIEIYRRNFTSDELKALDGAEPEIAVIVEFISGSVPVHWSLSPMNRTKGWLKNITGILKDEEFAILEEDAESESA